MCIGLALHRRVDHAVVLPDAFRRCANEIGEPVLVEHRADLVEQRRKGRRRLVGDRSLRKLRHEAAELLDVLHRDPLRRDLLQAVEVGAPAGHQRCPCEVGDLVVAVPRAVDDVSGSVGVDQRVPRGRAADRRSAVTVVPFEPVGRVDPGLEHLAPLRRLLRTEGRRVGDLGRDHAPLVEGLVPDHVARVDVEDDPRLPLADVVLEDGEDVDRVEAVLDRLRLVLVVVSLAEPGVAPGARQVEGRQLPQVADPEGDVGEDLVHRHHEVDRAIETGRGPVVAEAGPTLGGAVVAFAQIPFPEAGATHRLELRRGVLGGVFLDHPMDEVARAVAEAVDDHLADRRIALRVGERSAASRKVGPGVRLESEVAASFAGGERAHGFAGAADEPSVLDRKRRRRRGRRGGGNRGRRCGGRRGRARRRLRGLGVDDVPWGQRSGQKECRDGDEGDTWGRHARLRVEMNDECFAG